MISEINKRLIPIKLQTVMPNWKGQNEYSARGVHISQTIGCLPKCKSPLCQEEKHFFYSEGNTIVLSSLMPCSLDNNRLADWIHTEYTALKVTHSSSICKDHQTCLSQTSRHECKCLFPQQQLYGHVYSLVDAQSPLVGSIYYPLQKQWSNQSIMGKSYMTMLKR